jgi:ubiquinone/menaquinone biosynthesis C-methylase UbiE
VNEKEAAQVWNGNADAWTKLARAGYDVYRDFLNTPAFLEMLPEVRGLRGLDIGCGEGHNTRLLRDRGASVVALDISTRFLRHATDMERGQPAQVRYLAGNAQQLPFADDTFDFATAFMSLMDVSDSGLAIAEAHRVLKPGGCLQFSISHPCFDTPHRKNLRDATGRTYAFEVGDYYRNLNGEAMEWLFSAAPAEAKAGLVKFRVPRFTRTLSEWLNAVVAAGFAIERVAEPTPSDDVVRRCPALQDAQVVSYFLHIRGRKRNGSGLPSH